MAVIPCIDCGNAVAQPPNTPECVACGEITCNPCWIRRGESWSYKQHLAFLPSEVCGAEICARAYAAAWELKAGG